MSSTDEMKFAQRTMNRFTFVAQLIFLCLFIISIAHKWPHTAPPIRARHVLMALIFPGLWLCLMLEKSSFLCRWLATFAFIVLWA